MFINTTQLYSNLEMKYYLSVPCVGCPCISNDLEGQACLAMHSAPLHTSYTACHQHHA